jgi:hypothetical protein
MLNQEANQRIMSHIYFAIFQNFAGGACQKEPLGVPWDGWDGSGTLWTDVGTDKMCKIINVYRPWDGGTDKLGGRR